jgi:MATE family multidrug resistance protein
MGITRPQALGGVLAAIAHPVLCYCFVWRWEMGVVGAALAWSASSAVCLATQVAYATIWRKMFRERDEALALKRDMCWPEWQLRRAISAEGLWEYFALALPGVAMKMEWWASEMIVVFAGFLPNPEIALSALSIYGTTNAFVFDASIGLGVASLTRVTHELGAGDAKRARRAVAVSFQLIACVGVLASAGIIIARKDWAKLFTSREDVRELVSELMIALAAYALFDCAGAVQAGVARACGKQSIAAKVVFVAYWIIGIPLSLSLAFGAHMGALGLVLGGLVATMVHTGALGYVIARRLDWDAEVVSARDRHARSTSHAAEAGHVPRSSSFALLEAARANDLTRQYGAAV